MWYELATVMISEFPLTLQLARLYLITLRKRSGFQDANVQFWGKTFLIEKVRIVRYNLRILRIKESCDINLINFEGKNWPVWWEDTRVQWISALLAFLRKNCSSAVMLCHRCAIWTWLIPSEFSFHDHFYLWYFSVNVPHDLYRTGS